MHHQKRIAIPAEDVHAGIGPNIRAGSAVLAELEVVDMRGAPMLA